MLVKDRFDATLSVKLPAAYLLGGRGGPADSVVARLRQHGIVVELLTAPMRVSGERFAIDSMVTSGRPFQGHSEVRLEGRWNHAELEAPAGRYLVRTTQPLGVLAAILLEPQSDDGFATWNVFDSQLADAMRGARLFPVERVLAPPGAAARIVP
jgi:hypothetical protein